MMALKQPGTIRLASYNMRKGLGNDRKRDPARTLRVISALQADIVVLQEADLRLGNRNPAIPIDNITEATGMTLLPVADNGISLGWHGITILTRPEVTISALHRTNLPGLEPRGAVMADLLFGNQPLRVVGLHLGLLRRSRHGQQRHVLNWLEDQPTFPTALAGDLNEWSQRRGLDAFAAHFSLHAPGKSFHARAPVAALDRIALSDDLTSQAAGVLDTPVTRRASDHLPIWMDIAPRE